MVAIVVLMCISLMTYEASSHRRVCHSYIFFGEASIKVFGPFFKIEVKLVHNIIYISGIYYKHLYVVFAIGLFYYC